MDSHYRTDNRAFRLKASATDWLIWLTVAALYTLTARLALFFFAPEGNASVFFVASGLALAAILLGGKRYVWAIFSGALALNLWQGKDVFAAITISAGSAASAWLGAWLIKRMQGVNHSLQTLRDYLLLISLGGVVACTLAALVGTLTLLGSDIIQIDNFLPSLVHWWMGDTLGVILITPLILVWSNTSCRLQRPKRLFTIFVNSDNRGMRKPYPSDISREQFEQIRPLLEGVRKQTKPRTVDLYDVFCGVLYLLKSGCQWRMIPSDFPKWRTVYAYFEKWREPAQDGISVLEQALKKSGWRGQAPTGAERLDAFHHRRRTEREEHR